MGTLGESPVLWLSVAVFSAAYSIGRYGLFRRWNQEARLDASSCCMSVIHGSASSLLAGYCLLHEPWVLDAPNTSLQNAVMELSLAYFLLDLLHYALFVPHGFHFILHHIATSTYIWTCRYFTRHGAISVMILLFFAEITSPVQNTWTLSNLARPNSSIAANIHRTISPFFIVYFSLVRGLCGPLICLKLGSFYFAGKADAVIPRWLAIYWTSTASLAVMGSLIWVHQLWLDWFKGLRAKSL